MIDWLGFLGAFGLGSVITALVQSFLSIKANDRQRRYLERKEAYIGLLDSWRKDDEEGNPPSNAFVNGHWALRCQLVGSDTVKSAIDTWMATEPGTKARQNVTKAIKRAMRDDLK